jgi:hypothetical protein
MMKRPQLHCYWLFLVTRSRSRSRHLHVAYIGSTCFIRLDPVGELLFFVRDLFGDLFFFFFRF